MDIEKLLGHAAFLYRQACGEHLFLHFARTIRLQRLFEQGSYL